MYMREFKITDRITIRSEGISRYLNEISTIPLMTSEEEHEVAIAAATGDRDAINRLVRANLRFVVSVAKMYHGGNTSMFEDLINEGNHGLVEAAESFDPTRGFKFISYAVWYIRKDMLKYLTNNSRLIRVPLNKTQALRKMSLLESDLAGVLGRTPTSDEIIEAYQDWHLDEKGSTSNTEGLRAALVADNRPTPLESPFNGSDETSMSPIHIINGDLQGADYLAVSNNTRDMILPYVEQLPYIDKEIILYKFGFKNGGETMSFGEIGDRLGYTAERMRHRYKLSIRRIQSAMRRGNVTIDQFV